MTRRAFLGLFALLAIACSAGSTPGVSSGSTSPVAVSAPATGGPSSAASVSPSAGGSGSADFVVGGDRPVTIHVPPSYDPARPAPLLILLHGYGSTGQDHDAYFGLGDAARQRGFIYAYPDGTMDSAGNRFWNATDACCDFERTGIADDAYLVDVIGAVQARLAVDPKRIDFVGHSNGGFMSYRMACAHADLVAAIVSLAGTTFNNPADCRPAAPVAILQIHGTADDVVAFGGGRVEGVGAPGGPMASYPGAEMTAALWARNDGCAVTPSPPSEPVDVDADLADGSQPAEAQVTRWPGCRPGGAVELWTIPHGSHAPKLSSAFPNAALTFLAAHPKP